MVENFATEEKVEETVEKAAVAEKSMRDILLENGYHSTALALVPYVLSGACFHGECWERCPHCGNGIEMMGNRSRSERVDGVRITLCPHCGKPFRN